MNHKQFPKQALWKRMVFVNSVWLRAVGIQCWTDSNTYSFVSTVFAYYPLHYCFFFFFQTTWRNHVFIDTKIDSSFLFFGCLMCVLLIILHEISAWSCTYHTKKNWRKNMNTPVNYILNTGLEISSKIWLVQN